MEKQEKTTAQEVLINLLIKLRECEKEFQEQADKICERNPSVSYEDTESKFYCGIGDCMAAVGYFIGENAIRDTYDKIPEPEVIQKPPTVKKL
jgi:hypothetical protein